MLRSLFGRPAAMRRPGVTPGLTRLSRRAALKVLTVAIVVMSCTAAAAEPVREPAPPPPQPDGLLPVAHWQASFDRVAAAERGATLNLSRSPDSWDHYNLAYQIDANVSLFEASGEPRYADFAFTLAENLIGSARRSSTLPGSAFKDRYQGWAAMKMEPKGNEVPLFESYAWRYVTRLLRAVRASPLYNDSAFRSRYEKILAFTEKHIFEKWFVRDAARFIYRERTHMAAHWAYISLDLARVTKNEKLRKRYQQVVANIDNKMPNYRSSLRGQLRPSRTEPDAYWWSDVWGRTTGYGQDVAHGNGVISYVVESCDLNAGWTNEELSRFSRTLTAFVLRKDGNYPAYVSGRGSGNGWLADGFVKLGRYDRAVQGALEKHGVQNSQFYASMALNIEILSRAQS